MSVITELRAKQDEVVAAAREKLNEIDEDCDEARAKELEGQHDEMMADFDRYEARIQRELKMEAMEVKLQEPDPRRPKGDDVAVRGGGHDDDRNNRRAGPTKDEAFRSFLIHGVEGCDASSRRILREMRAQGVGSDPGGGFTVPTGFQAELVKALKLWGPMHDPGITRELETTSGNTIEWPTTDDTSNMGAILAENVADPEQDMTFGQKTLDAYKYTSKTIRVSEELLQDAAFNIEQVIRDAMAERLGRVTNLHFTTGTGSGQPNGIVTASAAGVTGVSVGTGITFDNMIDLVHSIDPAYRGDPSVRFMFNDSVLKALRKVKAATSGEYIWSPSDQRTGAPATILGYSYAVNQAMADMANGSKSILFGQFNKYVVRRVREFAVKRLVERYADLFQVGFLGFGRFDGELLDTNSVKHMAFVT